MGYVCSVASFDEDDRKSARPPPSGPPMSSPIRIYVTVGLLSVGVAAVFFAIPPRYEARRAASRARAAEARSAWVAERARLEEARAVGEAFPGATVDLAAELSRAHAAAQAVIPHAMLSTLTAKNVRPNGHADLLDDVSVEFEFVAPPDGARPSVCALAFRYTLKHGRVQETTTRCDTPPMPLAPQCTWPDIWREVARRKGPGEALISVTLKVRAEKAPPMWEVDGAGEPWLIPDSCTPTQDSPVASSAARLAASVAPVVAPTVAAGGCMKDTDCKGNRICTKGECVSP